MKRMQFNAGELNKNDFTIETGDNEKLIKFTH